MIALKQAGWLAAYLHELVTFPNGKHDDQVDSTSQALKWFRKGTSQFGAVYDYYDKV